jgi:hypothetical protein
MRELQSALQGICFSTTDKQLSTGFEPRSSQSQATDELDHSAGTYMEQGPDFPRKRPKPFATYLPMHVRTNFDDD